MNNLLSLFATICLACSAFTFTRFSGIAFLESKSFVLPEGAAPTAATRDLLEDIITDTQPETKGKDDAGGGDGGGFAHWRSVAMDLSKLPAEQVLLELERNDPFETRAFESKLLQAEGKRGSLLNTSELRQFFPCPVRSHRITLPDARNHTSMNAFQNRFKFNTDYAFLFFQHLRKAGGTAFCKLAEANLPSLTVPPYFCMPDMDWNDTNQCAGCLARWTNNDIVRNMKARSHRIASNEWDAFDSNRFFELPAVFATGFRRPLDRAVSQFRFDCIDNQGCKGVQNITEWWEDQAVQRNVYTWTFTNLNQTGIANVYHSNKPEDAEKRADLVGQAVDTLSQFHLILIMEWLGYSAELVQSVLGFPNTETLTHRVRPQFNLYARNDGHDMNQLGASGVNLASWDPKNFLSSHDYRVMSEDLALDMILNEVARRIFLERTVCTNG